MGNPFTMLKHIGLGAGLMYLFDPQLGRSRRARMANQLRGTLNELTDTFDEGVRDIRHRAYGTLAEARSGLTADDADDRVIVERVRSKMGRWVSHPRGIEVSSRGGLVTLRGPILRAEADRLLEVVSGVRGVREVIDRLEVHESPGSHPALQGGSLRPGERAELWQENWSPGTKVMLGTAGAVAGLALVRQSGLMLPALALAGAAWAMSRTEGDPLEQMPDLGELWGGRSRPTLRTEGAPTVREGSMI